MPHSRLSLPLALAISFIAAGGCTRKPQVDWGTAEGQVLLDGQPVTQGTIIFDNRQLGIARLADIQADGHFVQQSVGFAGLPVGTYRVAVNSLGVSKGDFVPVAPSKTPQKSPIPAKYHSPETSGLSAEVKSGKNAPLLFELVK